MTLLELVIRAHRCRSTHHFIAIDALSLIDGKDAEQWHDLLLRHHQDLLKGAKAPDATFKDFQNHVLHVGEGEWGGAPDAAMDWYGRAVAALRAQKWEKAAYALGVLTHYYADPIQPFHTAQSEEEGAIHRALEWSIAKSRPKIRALIEQKGYPSITASEGTGFVSDMVRDGARLSNPHYRTFIERYNVHAGVKNPEDGLDDVLLDIISDLIAYATAGVALLFRRAFSEAAVKPPQLDLDLPGYLTALDIPIRRITKRMADAKDRRQVEAMYAELKQTGKVIKTLPKDDKFIRKLHAQQVLRRPISDLDQQALEPLGTRHGRPAKDGEWVRSKSVETSPISVALPVVETKPAPRQPITIPTLVAPPQAPVNEKAKAPSPAASETAAPESTVPVAALVEAEIVKADKEAVTKKSNTKSEPKPEKVVVTKTPAAPVPKPAPEPTPVLAKAKPGEPANSAEPMAENRARLTRKSPVVDAPSIGPKTAARLAKVNVITIGDLMDADTEALVEELSVRYIKIETVQDWKDQTGLMLDMPALRVLDAQILVGAGIRNSKDLAKASARKVLTAATSFLDTPSGSRVLWGGEAKVEENEVKSWIEMARKAA